MAPMFPHFAVLIPLYMLVLDMTLLAIFLHLFAASPLIKFATLVAIDIRLTKSIEIEGKPTLVLIHFF